MPADARLLGGLDLLEAVVQTGSFVAAGKRIGLTQSGTSRAVARLEERVGVRLFDRNARSVVLTDEGQRFHAQVAPLLAALTEAVDGAASSRQRVRGRLRVQVDGFFASHVLGPRLAGFVERYPEISLEVVVRGRGSDLVGEGFDLAVRFDEPRATGVIARRLLQTRIVTCAAPAYLARRGRPRQPKDLARDHECILFTDPQTGLPYDWEFHRSGRPVLRVDVTGHLVVDDVATGVAACVGGLGVAQLMELGTRELVREGALVELFPRWQNELLALYVLYPSRHLPPAKVRAFVDFVAE